MECVKTVKEFALKNAEDLKRFMIFKTGIHDVDLIGDTIQEFYVKLIESRALESYDPTKGAFKTYIMNLFCWLLPVLAKRNVKVKYTFISQVRDRDHWGQGYMDVFDGVASDGTSPYMGNTIDPCYDASHARESEELESGRDVQDFIEHIRRTQSPKIANRLISFVEHREQGCNGVEVARILGLSNNVVKVIKDKAVESYEQWEGHKMSTGKSAKKLTYADVVHEIGIVQDLITRYNAGEMTLPTGFTYREAILRLKYLRNRQAQMGKRKPKSDSSH